MSTVTQLHELTEEALNFGEVINFAENLNDSDFCNACALFSEYLTSQLNSLAPHNQSEHTQLLINQLNQLGQLLAPSQSSEDQAWLSSLNNYQQQIVSLKSIAA